MYHSLILSTVTGILLAAQQGLDFSSYSFNDIQKIKNVSTRNFGPIQNQFTSFNADNSIDDQSYRVGSGDEFMVALSSNPSVNYSGKVNQNGDLFIAEIGIVGVHKLRLCDAKKKIAETYGKVLKKEVYVSLEKVKTATVNIIGQVSNPGTYSQPALLRLADVIKLANNDSMPPHYKFNYRKISCYNGDSANYYDLYQYLFRGDLSQNPYIFPGDQITIFPVTQNVFLEGEIFNVGGRIPLLPNEDICSFLDLFDLSAAADSEKIIIQRTDRKGLNRSITVVNYKKRESFSLQNSDMIIVTRKENYPEPLLVRVSGEVARPGSYPITKEKITAQTVIEMAGGPSEFADLNRAVVVRQNKQLPGDNIVKEVRPEINSSFSMLKYSRDYSIIYLKDQDVVLDQNDKIVIPKKELYVYVSGSVGNPGGKLYKEGEPVSYYIMQAGGYQKRADRRNMYIMTNYDNTVVSKEKNSIILPGDIVVVPVSQENKTMSTIIIPLVSVISTTVVVMLSVYNTYQSTRE